MSAKDSFMACSLQVWYEVDVAVLIGALDPESDSVM